MRRAEFKDERKELIAELKKNTSTTNKKIWSTLATKLSVPRRQRKKINLSRLERLNKQLKIKPTEINVVPGKVLATGNLETSMTVAAFEFSEKAKKKIKNAKGKTMSLQELLSSKPKEKDLKIIV